MPKTKDDEQNQADKAEAQREELQQQKINDEAEENAARERGELEQAELNTGDTDPDDAKGNQIEQSTGGVKGTGAGTSANQRANEAQTTSTGKPNLTPEQAKANENKKAQSAQN